MSLLFIYSNTNDVYMHIIEYLYITRLMCDALETNLSQIYLTININGIYSKDAMTLLPNGYYMF